MHAATALQALIALRDPDKAAFFQRFFKCGPGQYGEGDQFLGLSVPQVRSVLAAYRTLPVPECVALRLAAGAPKYMVWLDAALDPAEGA